MRKIMAIGSTETIVGRRRSECPVVRYGCKRSLSVPECLGGDAWTGEMALGRRPDGMRRDKAILSSHGRVGFQEMQVTRVRADAVGETRCIGSISMRAQAQ